MSTEMVSLATRTSPMSISRKLRPVPHGATIEEMVNIALPEQWERDMALVRVQGRIIPRQEWHRRPDPGQLVQVVVIPQGGGNTGLRVALVLVVVVLAVIAGPYGAAALGFTSGTTGFAAASAGITAGLTLAGTLAINALVPPETQDVNDKDRESDTYAITGSRNRAKPFERVPMVFGEHRFYPPFAATPTFDVEDNDVYFLALVCWGAGKIDVDNLDLKIGDTPINKFDSVQVEHFNGRAGAAPVLELYSRAREELEGGGEIKSTDGRVSRTTGNGIVRWRVEIVFPRGLIRFEKSSGKSEKRTIKFKLFDRKTGDTEWDDRGEVTVVAETTEPIRRTFSRQVSDLDHPGSWDVGIIRTTNNTDNTRVADETIWSALRTYRNEPPVTLEHCAVSVIYMRSTGQLQGITDRINGVPRPLTDDYDVDTDTWIERTTSNPASQFLRLIRHPWAAYAVTSAKIDFPSFVAWHNYCRERDLRFDYVVDYKLTRWELMDKIATAGDATYGFVDGEWRIYIDGPKPLVADVFSPREMRNFRSTISYFTQPDAVRVGFPNKEFGYKPDEVIVYSDGFDEDTAVTFESLEFPGKVRADEIQRRVKRRFAEALFRGQTWSFFTDIRHLTCERFDRIIIQHDSILSGVGNGRVMQIETDGDPLEQIAIVIDSEVVLESGRLYAVVWPSASTGLVEQTRIVTTVGQSARLVLEAPLADGTIELDDIIGVVEVAQDGAVGSQEAIIKEILPEREFGAQILAVPYRKEIHDADFADVPEWTSKLTQPPGSLRPVILKIYSDETVAQRLPGGKVVLRAFVTIYQSSSDALTRASSIALRWRDTAEGSPWAELSAAVDAGRIIIDSVAAGSTIQVQARFVWLDGSIGEWSAAVEHDITGVFIAPPDVDVVFQDGDLIRWRGELDEDHAGYILRTSSAAGQTWDSAKPLHDGVFVGDVLSVDLLPSSAAEIFVKAITNGDIQSENATTGAVDKSASSDRVALVVIDYAADGWPGDIEGGSVVGDEIQAGDTSAMWPDPVAAAWPDPAAAAFDTSFDALVYEATFAVPDNAKASDVIVISEEVTGVYALSVAWVNDALVRWAEDDDIDDLFEEGDDFSIVNPGLPFGAFQTLETTRPEVTYRGPLRPVLGEVLRIRIAVDGGSKTPVVISNLKVSVEAQVLTELFDDFAISPAQGETSVRVPVSVVFRRLLSVQALLATGNAADVVRTIDKSEPLAGPLIAAYNIDGTIVPAVADIAISGI